MAPNPTPAFFNTPLRYIRWSARERPAYLWSVVIGVVGLGMLATVPPIQKRMGYERSKPIPMTYPIPSGPRKQLSSYDD